MHNPFSDTLAFLFGSAQDYNPFGASRYISVVFYLLVIAGSFVIAWRNWRADPAQRSAHHVWIWLMRLVAAGMWYQGTIWKLPLPVGIILRCTVRPSGLVQTQAVSVSLGKRSSS